MTTTDQTVTRTSRTALRLSRTVLSLLLAAAAVVGLNVQGASAWTSGASGSYGWVTPRPVLGGRTYVTAVGALYGSYVPAVTVFGPVVGRSGATSGAQTVEYRFAVYQWSGSQWVTTYNTGAPYVQVIGAGQASTTFGADVTQPQRAGYNRVTFTVTWKDAYGRVLGTRSFDDAHASDYNCAYGVTGCVVGQGWVWI